MNCSNCGGKGWIESFHGGSASWTPSLQQCSKRCNISGYSNEVQRRLNNPNHVTETPVLQSIPPTKRKLSLVVPLDILNTDAHS